MEDLQGMIKITTPADPEKLAAYIKSKKLPNAKLDKMGRRKSEKVAMTKQRADAILDAREAQRLRRMYY